MGKLGFGLMRLPKKDGEINIEELSKMVDLFLERGYTYFDTAFVYKGSEEATRKALVERHPRDSYTLASKLHVAVVPNKEEAEQEFYTSLERCGTDYFDYYLLHALTEKNYETYEQYDLWNFVQARKAEGKIRHIGFSFHGGPELLEKLLTEHPEVEFVQLQINYADWENPKVHSRRNYEIVRRFGKKLVIMEPVKGGTLMRLPKAVRDIFAPSAYAPAEWALKFAASMDGLLAVLSGMSDMAQMEENTSLLRDFDKLSEEEFATAVEAGICFSSAREIPCTACGYCLEGCPQQIQIPKLFAAYNELLFTGNRPAYESIEGVRADGCLACGKCEEVCPQHIQISEKMQILAETFRA